MSFGYINNWHLFLLQVLIAQRAKIDFNNQCKSRGYYRNENLRQTKNFILFEIKSLL